VWFEPLGRWAHCNAVHKLAAAVLVEGSPGSPRRGGQGSGGEEPRPSQSVAVVEAGLLELLHPLPEPRDGLVEELALGRVDAEASGHDGEVRRSSSAPYVCSLSPGLSPAENKR